MKQESKKVIGARLPESTVAKITALGGFFRMSYADIINNAVDRYLDELYTKESGGLVLRIPNPQFFHCSEEDKKVISETLSSARAELVRYNPGLDFGLRDIEAFSAWRFFKDDEKKRERFRHFVEVYSELFGEEVFENED